MTVVTQIPGYDLASDLFKKVVLQGVTVPTDTVNGENWYNYLKHRELSLKNYLKKGSEQERFGYENWPEQARLHIQSEQEEIAHLELATKGYPFKLGNLSFLSDSKNQDGYLWPVFVPLDIDSPHFQIKVNSYDSSVEFRPYSLHPEIRTHYQRAVDNLMEIRRKTRQDSVSISYSNLASPPDWARKAIAKAQSSRLFSKIYILIDHSTLPWEIVNGATSIDIAEMRRLEAIAAAEEAERQRTRNLRIASGIYVDPMVIGYNTYTRNYEGFGQFSTSSWTVLALYDPSKHEQYVYDQYAIEPRNF